MDGWTEEEFQRVAQLTRISERTLEACKDVLVNGMRQYAAAEKHKMFDPQVARAITILRTKQAELVDISAVEQDSAQMAQLVAAGTAKALFGPNFNSRLAQPGQSYTGLAAFESSGFLLQMVGSGGILHDLTKLAERPAPKSKVCITYDKKGGLARVTTPVEHAKDSGLER